MDYRVSATNCCTATIALPASKSLSNRVLVMNALCNGGMTIENLSTSEDTQVLQQALTGIGGTHDLRGAGTAMRFLTAYFAQKEGESHTLTGSSRMCERPIGILVDALRQLGAEIEYLGAEGFPPLRIQGKRLVGGTLTLPGNVSSQYISALLLIAPYLQQGLSLSLTSETVSRPYIAMTIGLMQQSGIVVTETENSIEVSPGAYTPRVYCVESDWSAASYWYEAVALAPEAKITLSGLSTESLQGDARIAQLFEPLGVTTIIDKHGITLQKNDLHTPHYEADLSGEPDLAQTLVVTCCLRGVPFRFTGLQTLRIKETDRIAALQSELAKLGYPLTITNHSIAWEGSRIPIANSITIDTYNDHRMAMAFAPAAFAFPELKICDIEVVAKSYPDYWNHLVQVGFIFTPESKGDSAL